MHYRRAMETNMTRKASGSLSILLFSIVVWGGCTVGPNYKRPTVDVPVTYRYVSGETQSSPEHNATPSTPQQTAASLGDEKWWDVFQDEELRSLIRIALK